MKESIINKYIEHNNLLLATIDTKNKTIESFNDNNKYTYRQFFMYMARYYQLDESFIDKAIVVIDSIDSANEEFELNVEYKKISGEPVNFTYNILKSTKNEFLLFVQENKTLIKDNVDQMTKAVPKSYIDNRAKSNMLTKTPFVVFYVDIDDFKHINDEYGQVIGDMILIEMVSNAKTMLADRGAIARIGGDRFFVIYEIDDDYDTVHNFLFEFKQNVQRVASAISRGIHVTVTIGSSQYPSDGEYELLLKKCMKALIRGKNKGRDCFIMYLVEKCGVVTIDDEIQDKIVKIENTSSKNDIYSLINNVNQLLSDERNFDESINKAIGLIGNYFYIDRISIARIDIKTFKIKTHHAYYNPKISNKYPAYCVNEIIPYWAEAMGVKKYVNIDDASKLDDFYPLKDLFQVDHTTASIAFELMMRGKSYGIIRFDMTTGARHWQPEDFQVFMLLSQLFATFIQKNYLVEVNYSSLYLDPVYNCSNFTKFFKDAGEYILNNNLNEYSIFEFDVDRIITIREIIGERKVKELMNIFTDFLDSCTDIIYGKKYNGPLIAFIANHDKKRIEEILFLINKALTKYSINYHLHNLDLHAGIYLANAKEDTLADSVGYANLTRNLCGKEKILYYSDDIKESNLKKNEMIVRFDEALKNNEFLLYLQPKISTNTGKLVGAEALTRWNYKFEQMLFPNDFISLFEEQGIIDKLDYNVFENVCRYQKNLKDNNLEIVPISVNVSRYIMDFDDYIKTIEDIRKKYDISPSIIEFEITEGMYYENTEAISKFIDKLHQFGYHVSMDDFGAGYSNLVTMAKLHFDVIKFDRSFCLGLENDRVKIMLNELMKLIKTMNMATICEGVETKDNVEYLTNIGCDAIQGYYYSKPIIWQDFIKKYYK